jgi:glycyl-tRNA synthetase beta chain
MTDFLLELGCEEIPAGYIEPALKAGKEFLHQIIGSKKLVPDGTDIANNITTYATPRRLVFCVTGLLDVQEDVNKEVTGPSAVVALDQNNDPTPAFFGFAKRYNLQSTDVKTKDTPKGKVCYANITIKGEKTDKILGDAILLLIKALPWPKSMWWLDKSLTFARPLRYLTAVLGKKPVKVSLIDIPSGNRTMGHPFFSAKPMAVKSADFAKYRSVLKKAKVLVDQSERRVVIEQGICKIADKYGATCDEPELLAEVTNLVEWPTIIECAFEESYLSLPAPVIESAMKSHQRYFPLIARLLERSELQPTIPGSNSLRSNCQSKKDGKLLPQFVVVSNNPNKGPRIREGNERVLKARLADAAFFWEQDRKTPLSEYAKRLNSIAFLGKLGTMAEKSERLKELGRFIASELKYAVSDTISRAAELCKADLLTGMVGEFPDLQGIMGYEYLKDTEPDVAVAIKEHYQPRFAGDALPQTPAGICLSLAEKLDTLASCFTIGLTPSGSHDPYGLRRQALGALKIILANKLNISLNTAWDRILELLIQSVMPYASELGKLPDPWSQKFWQAVAQTHQMLDNYRKEIKSSLNKFVEQRFYQMLVEEEGISAHIFNAVVIPHGIDNLLDRYNRITTLHRLSQETGLWNELVEAVERTHNIGKGASATGEVSEELLKEQAEQELWTAYKNNKDQIQNLINQSQYEEASRLYHTSFAKLAHIFFEKVYVNVEDPSLKNNRVLLNQQVNRLYSANIADLSRIPRK